MKVVLGKNKKHCLLALWRTPTVGSKTIFHLMEKFSDLADLFTLSPKELEQLGLTTQAVQYLLKPDWQAVEKDLRWAEQPLNEVLTWFDAEYPSLLREIVSAPPVLFVRGNISALTTPQLAIVGSRNPTSAGVEIAKEFAAHLAVLGLTITSGLALGIDAAGHRGALQAAGTTVAVLGAGIDRIYPFRHKELAEKIIEKGALVSEFPPEVPPKAENFPRRNRIISGLSLGVLIVEAALQSGSLITAKYAVEQGREVFAVPGSIHNPLTKGCHALLKQGAKLVEKTEDIVEELNNFNAVIAKPSAMIKENSLALTALDGHYAKLLKCLGTEPTSVDTLISRSGLAVSEVTSLLLTLELQGYLTAVPGGYVRSAKITMQ